MKSLHLFILLAALGPIASGAETVSAPKRPRIIGISHAAFFVSDMKKAREFYEDFLGYQSPFSIPRKNPTEQLVWIKINDRQTVELYPEGSTPPTEMKVGVNGKRQINFYDVDGTRVEIMEPATYDGKARPPSDAPPPVPEPKPATPSPAVKN
jgi:hypothetical protein